MDAILASKEPFYGTMFDRQTGKYVNIKEKYKTIDDEVYVSENQEEHCSLDTGYYAWHWCGCHREYEGSPPNEPEFGEVGECPPNRYIITELRHSTCPELNLMYEIQGKVD